GRVWASESDVTRRTALPAPDASLQFRPSPRKHLTKQLWRQHAGMGVVARAMIAVVKFQCAGPMHGAMGEGRGRATKIECFQDCIMRDPAKRDDRAQAWHGLDGHGEIRPAGIDFR